MSIKERYRWLIDRLIQDFPTPEYEVVTKEYDFGSAFGVLIKNSDKRHAFLVERLVDVTPKEERNYHCEKDEDGEDILVRGWTPKLEVRGLNYSADKEKSYLKMAKEFRKILGESIA